MPPTDTDTDPLNPVASFSRLLDDAAMALATLPQLSSKHDSFAFACSRIRLLRRLHGTMSAPSPSDTGASLVNIAEGALYTYLAHFNLELNSLWTPAGSRAFWNIAETLAEVDSCIESMGISKLRIAGLIQTLHTAATVDSNAIAIVEPDYAARASSILQTCFESQSTPLIDGLNAGFTTLSLKSPTSIKDDPMHSPDLAMEISPQLASSHSMAEYLAFPDLPSSSSSMPSMTWSCSSISSLDALAPLAPSQDSEGTISPFKFYPLAVPPSTFSAPFVFRQPKAFTRHRSKTLRPRRKEESRIDNRPLKRVRFNESDAEGEKENGLFRL
ncbi:hypothetical protein MKEN_00887000 [Mycena kentingensis (nom. inval.)]|nr:hypothetical protein MKEN_00887000 [Mycena kentingensis (nom. inval.)]